MPAALCSAHRTWSDPPRANQQVIMQKRHEEIAFLKWLLCDSHHCRADTGFEIKSSVYSIRLLSPAWAIWVWSDAKNPARVLQRLFSCHHWLTQKLLGVRNWSSLLIFHTLESLRPQNVPWRSDVEAVQCVNPSSPHSSAKYVCHPPQLCNISLKF